MASHWTILELKTERLSQVDGVEFFGIEAAGGLVKIGGIFLKGGGADDLGGAPRAAGVSGEGGGTPEPNAAALAEGIWGENQEARDE